MRAKAVIRDKAIPYQVPDLQELPARLGAVLQMVYLIFNAGYSAEATRAELSCEAIRLGRLLLDLLPEPEVMGLLGLMLLQESRRAARISLEGDLILLDHQNRALWNRDQIAEGILLTESALASRRFGAYTLQAAIAAVHADASAVGIHGLEADHGTLRPAAAHPAISGCGTQPRRCSRHVRGAGEGPSPYRRPARTWRTR